jgi:hypothetical protein
VHALNDGCFEIEDLEAVMAAEKRGDHPAHLDECPRCRALLASYQAFLKPPDLPPGARVKEAADRLRLPVMAGFEEDHGRTSAARRVAPGRGRIRLGVPWLRPVWGLAAIVLVVILVRQVTQESNRNLPSHVLRGDESAGPAAVVLLPPQVTAEGEATLSWRAVPGAEAYTIVFYRSDMAVIGRRTVDRDTTASVPKREAGELLSKGLLFWQVRAMKSGAETGHSAPRQLVLPGSPGR